MIKPLQVAALADGPRDGHGLDSQARLDVVEQVEAVAALAVEFVDEGEDRRVAHPAHVHQLLRAALDALDGVDDHERRVDGGEDAKGVLGKVLVARRVEQVERPPAVVEPHHRRGDGDAALALDGHPVGRRLPPGLARPHIAGEVDRAAEQKELLGERRLTGVRVRDDAERAPDGDLGGQVERRGAARRCRDGGRLGGIGFGRDRLGRVGRGVHSAGRGSSRCRRQRIAPRRVPAPPNLRRGREALGSCAATVRRTVRGAVRRTAGGPRAGHAQ